MGYRTTTATVTAPRPAATTTTRRRRRRLSPWTALWIVVVVVLGVLAFQPHLFSGIENGDDDESRRLLGLTAPTLVADLDDCDCNTATTADINVSLAASMGLFGTIADCCCSFADLEMANVNVIYPLLQKTVATPFFAHFKIDLNSNCPLWDDAPVCMLRDCSVCPVDEPADWALNVDCDIDDDEAAIMLDDDYNTDDQIVTTVDWHVRKDWSLPPVSFLDTAAYDNNNNNVAPFMTRSTSVDGTTSSTTTNDTAIVVDLRLNPERYTGYGGSSASKVWSAIHLINCFQQQQDDQTTSEPSSSSSSYHHCSLSPEQRVYNRVISGMHSSISLHIAHSFCLEMDPRRSGECQTWGFNQEMAQSRVLNHLDRLENLYVAFALLLRAVQKAGPAISAAVPHSEDDNLYADSLVEWQDHLWPELSRLAQSCPVPFDEVSVLTAESARPQLLRRFRHLQRIMQCVGCDRCKLWGTLQTLGVGTALKILLPNEDGNDDTAVLTLTRQEAVALVHTLERFSSAIVFANELRGVATKPNH